MLHWVERWKTKWCINIEARIEIAYLSPALFSWTSFCGSYCDSKKRLRLNMNIPNEVRIIDIADLLTLLDEVKKGISPYYLVKKIFSL